MWHFKGTFGTFVFPGHFWIFWKLDAPPLQKERKTIKWKNNVMETRIKPCSCINRSEKTKTYIIQEGAKWNEEGDKKCTNAPDSPHLLCKPSPAPAAPHTTQIPCSPQSTKSIFTPVAPLAAASKSGRLVSVWTAGWRRRRLSNFLSSNRSDVSKQEQNSRRGSCRRCSRRRLRRSSRRSAAAIRSLNATRPPRSRQKKWGIK